MFEEMAKRYAEIKANKYLRAEGTDPFPVPTYQEWLDESAEIIFGHHVFGLIHGALEMVKYLWTRERLLIEVLQQKGIIAEHEVDEYFASPHSIMPSGLEQTMTRYEFRDLVTFLSGLR